MTYLGKMQGGTVVFEGDEKPEDGSIVRVEKVAEASEPTPLAKALLSLAGIIKDGPVDGSINHDHYLYGLPKKNE